MLKSATPVGWKKTALDHVAEVQTGIAKGKPINGAAVTVPYLRVANVQDGHVDLSVMKEISLKPSEVDRYSLRKGDVLFTEGGDFDKLGRGTVWHGEIEPCLHQNHVFAVRPNPDRLLPEFLAFQAASQYGRRYFQLSSKQSTNLASINSTQLKQFPVLLPPLPEQRKIAEILRTWDEAIAKLEALRAAKHDRLTGLTQKLLGLGGDFPVRWEHRPISDISTRVRRQNGGGDHPVMTISAKSGFRLQSDKFSRDMAGSSVDRYIVLHEGEFAYNKGNSLTAPYGCIFPLDRPTALVPFVYFCFALKADLNREFFAHLFAAGVLNHQLSRLINSGVRNDGLLNLSPEDFFGCKVPVPPADEQSAIASALTTAKREIGLLETEIEALTRQKRGLMQKLLTGEWRVKVEAD
jgi:type I restriction enzyme S subunit